jgi:pSer/pThr/pTyr-binding forkhead associated (FHA) protein
MCRMQRVEVEHQGQRIEIPIGETVVGRDSTCALRFIDASVSRRHMRFVRRPGQLFIEDLGSANGVRVNGYKIGGALQLLDGDRVELGHLALSVRIGEADDFDVPTDVKQRAERDRRRNERCDVELHIVYVSNELEIEVVSRDISESGVFVRSQVLDPIGTACTLMMQGVSPAPLRLSGVVRRVVERDGAATGLGVEFVGLAHHEAAMIRTLCGQAPPRGMYGDRGQA